MVKDKIGIPIQIVSDNGKDVRKGINLFCEDNSQVIFTYDITHKIGILLKKQLENDNNWQELQTNLTKITREVKQSDVSFLRPVTLNKKARWLNIQKIISWLSNIYDYQKKSDYTLIKQGYKIKNREIVFKSLQTKM